MFYSHLQKNKIPFKLQTCEKDDGDAVVVDDDVAVVVIVSVSNLQSSDG